MSDQVSAQETPTKEAFPPYEEHWLLKYYTGEINATLMLTYVIIFGVMCLIAHFISRIIFGQSFALYSAPVLCFGAALTLLWGYMSYQVNGTAYRGVPHFLGKRVRAGSKSMGKEDSNVFIRGTPEGINLFPIPSFLLDVKPVYCGTKILSSTATGASKDKIDGVGITMSQGWFVQDPHLFLGVQNPQTELDEMAMGSAIDNVQKKTAIEVYTGDRQTLSGEIRARFLEKLSTGTARNWGISLGGPPTISKVTVPERIAILIARQATEEMEKSAETTNIETRAANIRTLVDAGVSADIAAAMVSSEAGGAGRIDGNAQTISTSNKGGGTTPVVITTGGDGHHHTGDH